MFIKEDSHRSMPTGEPIFTLMKQERESIVLKKISLSSRVSKCMALLEAYMHVTRTQLL